jgi:hypothetical protein
MNLAVSSVVASRQGYLVKRKQLDRCLNAVEEAIERGEDVVSLGLEKTLRPVVPAVGRGMFLPAALDHIFASQEQLFSCQSQDEPGSDYRPAGQPDGSPIGWLFSSDEARMAKGRQISEADAKDLTIRIRDGLGEFPLLLLEAHEKRAWIPLRHRSWEQYVRLEFSLSRSRSYELLDQARVVRALRLAAGTQRIPPISALAAIEIKPLLGEVVDELREQLSAERQANVSAQIDCVVRDVVARARSRAAISKGFQSPQRRSQPESSRVNLRLVSNSEPQSHPTAFVASPILSEVVAMLAHQAPAAEVAQGLCHDEIEQLIDLPLAVRWLQELLVAWSTRRAESSVGSASGRLAATPR